MGESESSIIVEESVEELPAPTEIPERPRLNKDILSMMGFDQEIQAQTRIELEAMYGDRVFRYGQYVGTIADMSTGCPAFQLELARGVGAASAWLEINDQPPKEDLEDETKDISDEDPEKASDETPIAIDKEKTAVKTDIPLLAGEAASRVTIVKPQLETKKDAVKEDESFKNKPQQSEESGQKNETSTVDSGNEESTTTERSLRQKDSEAVPVLSSVEVEKPGVVYDEAIEGDSQESETQRVESVEPIEPTEFVEVAELEAEMPIVEKASQQDEYDNTPASEVQPEIKLEPEAVVDTKQDEKEKELEPAINVLELPALVSEVQIVHLVEEDTEKAESVEDIETPSLLPRVKEDPPFDKDASSTFDKVLESEQGSDQPVEESVELADTFDKAEIIDAPVIEAAIAFVVEVPEVVTEVPPEEIGEQAVRAIEKIEALEFIKTAEECREILVELRKELGALLRALGYMNVDVIVERLLKQYDIVTLKAYIVILAKKIQDSEGVHAVSRHRKARFGSYGRFGSHAVRMLVNINPLNSYS